MGQIAPPIFIVLGRVSIDGFVGAAVNGEVCLAVSVEVESFYGDWAGDGLFEDGGGNGNSFPSEVAR